jgi:hypothetical protein
MMLKLVLFCRTSEKNLHVQPQHIRKVLMWSQSRIHRISDLVKSDLAFLWVVPSEETLKNTSTSPGTVIKRYKV